MFILGWVLTSLLGLYEWILIARAVLSWVALVNREWRPHGVGLVAAEAVYTVTDPPLKLLGRFIRPWRVGSVSIDLAFIVLFVLVIGAVRVIGFLFA